MLERRSSARMPSRNFDGSPCALGKRCTHETRPAGFEREREQCPHGVVDLGGDLHGYRARDRSGFAKRLFASLCQAV